MSEIDDWQPINSAADDWQVVEPQKVTAQPLVNAPLATNVNVRHTGFSGQVADTFANPGPRPLSDSASKQGAVAIGDIAKGAPIGAASAAVGSLGDLETVGRLAGSLAGLPISRQNFVPNTQNIGDRIQQMVGVQSNKAVQAGRTLGGFAGPYLAAKGIDLAKSAIGTILTHALGSTTGSGAPAIQEAYNAGATGGPNAQLFLDQMRGNAPVSDVVGAARDAVNELKAARSADYQAGIGSTIQGDPTVLDFKPVSQAVMDSTKIGQYAGKTTIGGADKVWKKINDLVADWQESDPTVYHTPEGLDALKQRLNNLQFDEDLAGVAGPGKPGAKIVNAARKAVSDQITAQAPGYAKVMQDYANASDTLHEVETGLSVGQKSTVDTGLRKLQSIMRNNANTNYGQRVQLGNVLDQAAGGTLKPQVAGQMLSSATPRGIQGAMGGLGMLGAVATGNFGALPLAALTSPRLVGEGAYAAGQVGGTANDILSAIARADPAQARILALHLARLQSQNGTQPYGAQ